jgi:hypothetical protein
VGRLALDAGAGFGFGGAPGNPSARAFLIVRADL